MARDLGQAPLGIGPFAKLRIETRVADGDRRVVGEEAQQLGIVHVEGIPAPGLDRQHADRPGAARKRCRHDRGHPRAPDVCVEIGRVLELRIAEVVGGPDHATLGERSTGDALADRNRDVVRRSIGRSVGERQVERGTRRIQWVDHGRIGAQEPGRLVDRASQHRIRVADRGQLCGDAGERPLRLGLPPQVLVKLRIGERDGRVAGEGQEHLGVVRVERVGRRRHHAEGRQSVAATH